MKDRNANSFTTGINCVCVWGVVELVVCVKSQIEQWCSMEWKCLSVAEQWMSARCWKACTSFSTIGKRKRNKNNKEKYFFSCRFIALQKYCYFLYVLLMFSVPYIVISKNHEVKWDGLYKRIRHPSYLGLLPELLGLSLLFNTWFSLVVINVPVFPSLHYQMNGKEELLTSSFGAGYAGYMKRTRCVLPGIY